MTIPKSKLAKSVAEEISTSVSHYYFWWRVWNSLSITATVTSIVVSFIASVVAATRSIQHPAWAAVVAGLPAVILSLSQTIRFAERADWFWNLIVQYQSLQRAIKRGDLTIADASRFIDEIEINANAIDPSREKPAVINPATNTPAIPQKNTPQNQLLSSIQERAK